MDIFFCIFQSQQRTKLWLKAVSVTLLRPTTLFPPSSSINNILNTLSVICDYSMTCFKSILFYPSRLLMKWIYSSSAARKQSYTMPLSQLQHLFLSGHPSRTQSNQSRENSLFLLVLKLTQLSNVSIFFLKHFHILFGESSICMLCITPTCSMDTWVRFFSWGTKLSYLQLLLLLILSPTFVLLLRK